jgi:tight adherence protein B
VPWFALLVTTLVVIVALAIRAALSARQQQEDRRLATDESGVGLVRTPPPVAAQVGTRTRFDRWFDMAVMRSGMDASPAGVIAVMFLLAAALGGGLYLWKEQLGLAALGVAIGVVLPLAVVAYGYRQYRWQMQQQLPDALRMLAGSVRAGQTLEQAIDFFARHGGKPLAEEFSHCAALLQLGLSPAAALQSTAERVRLLDFDLLVSTVGLYSQTGGNLVMLLERLADSVRDRNQFAGQFAAATAQARIVAIAIGAAGPILLIVYALAEPEHVQAFFSSAGGWTVLGVCAVLEAIGMIWLWRILKIDY